MAEGIASIAFVDDLITILNNNWKSDNGGTKPQIKRKWEIKETGFATGDYAIILISIDSENPQIYSMLQGNSTDHTKFRYDWLHDVSVTLDVRTGISLNRVLQLTNETMRILKDNVVPVVKTNDYIRVLPENVTSANEEYRNLFRMLIDCSALRFNP